MGAWSYGYDQAGRMTSVRNPWNEITYYSYDGEGKLRVQNNANGTSTRYCYDELTGWPSKITNLSGASTVLSSFDLTYNGGANTLGNITHAEAATAVWCWSTTNTTAWPMNGEPSPSS